MRPSSTAVSTRLLRVKRHHASSSGPMAWIAADHGHEIALAAAAQRSYQIRQEARGKRLGAGVELNVRVRSHAMHYSSCLKKSKTGLVDPN